MPNTLRTIVWVTRTKNETGKKLTGEEKKTKKLRQGPIYRAGSCVGLRAGNTWHAYVPARGARRIFFMFLNRPRYIYICMRKPNPTGQDEGLGTRLSIFFFLFSLVLPCTPQALRTKGLIRWARGSRG